MIGSIIYSIIGDVNYVKSISKRVKEIEPNDVQEIKLIYQTDIRYITDIEDISNFVNVMKETREYSSGDMFWQDYNALDIQFKTSKGPLLFLISIAHTTRKSGEDKFGNTVFIQIPPHKTGRNLVLVNDKLIDIIYKYFEKGHFK